MKKFLLSSLLLSALGASAPAQSYGWIMTSRQVVTTVQTDTVETYINTTGDPASVELSGAIPYVNCVIGSEVGCPWTNPFGSLSTNTSYIGYNYTEVVPRNYTFRVYMTYTLEAGTGGYGHETWIYVTPPPFATSEQLAGGNYTNPPTESGPFTRQRRWHSDFSTSRTVTPD